MKSFFNIAIIVVLFVGVVVFAIARPSDELKPVIIASFIVFIAVLIALKFIKGSGVQYQQNIILIFGIAITVISWFANGYINNENEKKRNALSIEQSVLQSKRDLKIKVLLDAYFRLENSDRKERPGFKIMPYDYIYNKYTESALTSIQLLSGDSTIRLANQFILSGGKAHYRDLLLTLRNELRQELELPILSKDTALMPTEYRVYRHLDAPDLLTPEQQYQLTVRLAEFDRELIK